MLRTLVVTYNGVYRILVLSDSENYSQGVFGAAFANATFSRWSHLSRAVSVRTRPDQRFEFKVCEGIL